MGGGMKFSRIAVLTLPVGALAALLGALPALAQSTGLDSIHRQVAVGGRVCMADHSHHGEGTPYSTRRVAEQSAIRAWASFTILEYGKDWGNYTIAAGKVMNCNQTDGRWLCKTDARPCRQGKGKPPSKAKASAAKKKE